VGAESDAVTDLPEKRDYTPLPDDSCKWVVSIRTRRNNTRRTVHEAVWGGFIDGGWIRRGHKMLLRYARVVRG
jgi:hypothetical protein